MSIIITADSTCDLSEELIKKHGIIITPLYVNYDDKSFKDGVDVKPAQIFEYVQNTKKLPKTAAVTVADYTDVFSKIISDGNSVIHINISSDFSASHQNAVIASKEVEGDIHIVDSRNLSTGSGHTVLKAAELAEKGMSAEEITSFLNNEYIPKVNASFCIDTLTYLHKGGRCSTVAALGANLLKIKPCIEVVQGKMNVGKKYRGKLDNVLKQYVEDRLGDTNNIDTTRIFITHTGCSKEMIDGVIKEINRHCKFKEVIETTAGCTISNHCGPGTLGILYLNNN